MTSSSLMSAMFKVLSTFVLCATGLTAHAAELHVLMGIDPSDLKNDMGATASVAPAQSMTRAMGARATINQIGVMAEAMRASRTVENEIIIAPAHVTASAILHAYQLIGSSGQVQAYALVARNDIDEMSKLAHQRLYLPQQDSLRSYVAKGLIVESGMTLNQFSKVTYGNTSGGGLVALMFKMADVTVASETEAKEWIAANPGQARILKTSRPVPSGLNIVARKDWCATECGRLTEWINSPDSAIAGLGRFRLASAEAAKQFTYVASLGITTPDAIQGVTRVSAETVANLVKQDVTFVDTRSQKEYDNEHIRGAVLAPYVEKSLKEINFDASKDDFSALAGLKLDKSRPVVFFCNGPECWKSYKASRAAVKAGHTKVYWFRGGMPEWREKRLPVEGSNGAAVAKATAPAKPGPSRTVAER
ncbi:MAG: rhodanese-like domain-containing protein [Caldimonas sp.]